MAADASKGFKKTKVVRPPLERWYIYVLMTFIGLMCADLIQLQLRSYMIPTSAPPVKPKSIKKPTTPGSETLGVIAGRNIFHSDGVIPVSLKDQEGGGGKEKEDNKPVPSQLPLVLVGTLVHLNPARSIASFNLKGRNKILPFMPGDDIDGMAKLVKVERLRVIFRNTNNGRLEFVELKIEDKISFGTKMAPAISDGSDIRREGNKFTLKRSVLNSYLSNLDDLLTKARAVPYSSPGSGGKIEGFRILSISPGSVFEALGIERLDVIKSVNGEPVNSPAKAMEIYNALKNSNSIALGVERNGQETTFNYTITE